MTSPPPGSEPEVPAPASAEIDLDEYDYALPRERIAQQPAKQREDARLLVLERSSAASNDAVYSHGRVREIGRWLRPGDLLVVNATRVQPARLRGRRESGGLAEALLLGPVSEDAPHRMRALLKISGRLRPGIHFQFGPQGSALAAEIESVGEQGEVLLRFEEGASPYAVGEPPLPPYIERAADAEGDQRSLDDERYQTVFARVPGAIAAPTAGLHFSEALFAQLADAGIERAEVVLHVGAGTFRPLDDRALRSGRLHAEYFELPEATAEAVARTRARKGRVIAVGTTSVRVLEANADGAGGVQPGHGETQLFLYPGVAMRVVDGLVTNFHLPRSSLLLLVAAFAGRERILDAYHEALAHDYRFYSYGDAMLIL